MDTTLTDSAAPDGQREASTCFGDGRYRDLGLLARGGMGEVRRVHDLRLDAVVVMKLLDWELITSQHAREHFVAEAKLTASLSHPGLVAVHDAGELPDGRLWYTMAEVRGDTFAQIIRSAHSSALSAMGLRSLVQILARLCEPMAFAHRREVIHRDIKPANLMVGPFGEALVMDWGLALRLNDTEAGAAARPRALTGTPAYMAPEQARSEPLGRFTDVYMLGGVLFTVLTGRVPREGSGQSILDQLGSGRRWPTGSDLEALPLPIALKRICMTAMAWAPEDRYADAGALGAALGAWLDGEQRREEALATLADAQLLRPPIEHLKAEAARKAAQAKVALGALDVYANATQKTRGWALEDEATALLCEAATQEAVWLQKLRAALDLCPELPEAHAVLADHYAEQLREAEALRDRRAIAVAEAMLRSHDLGQAAALLAPLRPVVLLTDPPGAQVKLLTYVERGRRLITEDLGHLGNTPLLHTELPLGSHTLCLRREGTHELLYPLALQRGGSWRGVRPGEQEPTPVRLPRLGELGPDDCLVSAGWCWIGGDPQAPESLDRRSVWVDGFVMRRHPVTFEEYLVFINALLAEGREEEALRVAPRRRIAMSAEETPLIVKRDGDAPFQLDSAFVRPREPVTMVDWRSAQAYVTWYSAQTGRAWRLPNELEWEKAARGVDGRLFVWGDQPEASWANVAGATRAAPAPAEVGAWPVDRSPYGVEGLVGNTRDWCANLWTPEGPAVREGGLLLQVPEPEDPSPRAIRGGAWQSAIALARAATRFAGEPDRRYGPVGFRLVRSF